MSAPVLRVDRLSVEVGPPGSGRLAVREVSLEVRRGERVALVGESGCGKSLTARAIPGLLDAGSERVLAEGRIEVPVQKGARVRGGTVGMVFQDPGASLNPVLSVGRQVLEVVRAHRGLSRDDAGRVARGHLEEVELDPAATFHRYPHQLSGGMAQRAALAAALAGQPDFLIADEPTTALDATSQRAVLSLLRGCQEDREMGLLLITHDLQLAAGFAHRILVMYGGRIVEEGRSDRVLREPAHPYTRALLGAIPAGPGTPSHPGIPGEVPSPGRGLPGCLFAPRCEEASDRCGSEVPELRALDGQADEVRVACHHPLARISQE